MLNQPFLLSADPTRFHRHRPVKVKKKTRRKKIIGPTWKPTWTEEERRASLDTLELLFSTEFDQYTEYTSRPYKWAEVILCFRPFIGPDGETWCSCYLGRHCPKKGKHPQYPDWTQPGATSVARSMDHWSIQAALANPDYLFNIGLVCGHRVIGVDCDGDEAARRWMERFPFAQPIDRSARGFHFLYLPPPGDKIGNGPLEVGDGWRIDIKGVGGLIITHPSRHESGVDYALIDGWPRQSQLQTFPNIDKSTLRPAPNPPKQKASRPKRKTQETCYTDRNVYLFSRGRDLLIPLSWDYDAIHAELKRINLQIYADDPLPEIEIEWMFPRVPHTQQHTPEPDDFEMFANQTRDLAHLLMALLGDRGYIAVGQMEIARHLGWTRDAVRHHVKQLVTADRLVCKNRGLRPATKKSDGSWNLHKNLHHRNVYWFVAPLQSPVDFATIGLRID